MKKITLLILMIFLSFSGFSQVLNEGFEGGAFPPTAPGNWAVFQNGFGSNAWTTNTIPRTGLLAAYVNSRQNIGIGNTSKDFLATPLVTIPTNGELRFWARSTVSGNQGVKYQVRIASGALPANQTDEAAYTTLVQEWTEDQLSTVYNVYEEKVVSLAAFAGQSVYIAFVDEYTQTGTGLSGDTFLLDDVLLVTKCLDPTTLTATGITSTSANLGWTNPSGSTSWEIEVLPAGVTPPTGVGVVVGTNPYTATALTGAPFTPLQPLTSYRFYVRSICTFSGSAWVGPFNFTTSAAPPICGGNFVDAGGTTANYPNNSDSTVTINPINPGDKVTVTFTSFDTEASWDGLYVFNGNSIVAPQIASANPAGNVPGGLAGSFWGTAIPGPFTSTAADGSLTFRFRSDGSVNRPGWIANITCAAPPTCVKPITLTTTAITANSVTVGWTQPVNPDTSFATAWQVLALPCGSPAPTAGSTGWVAAGTNPFVMSGLTAGTCYNFYVRAVCSPTDSSLWSVPKSATTLPGCGGTFVDNGGPTANYLNSSDSIVTIFPTNAGEQVTVTFTAFDTEANWDGLYVFDGNSIAAPQIASANPAGNVPGGLAGSYWGTVIPGPFTSSSPDGSLTFRFRSDSSVNRPGWISNVTCALPPTCTKPKLLTVSNIAQTSATLGWTQPANPDTSVATAWEVLVLPCGSPVPTASATGWVSASTNPYIVTGLVAATCYDYYVRAVCSASDSSLWAGPKSFRTLIANDECTGSILAPVNQNTNCLQTVAGTIAGATASPQTNTCGGTIDDDDVWFHFVATATTHYISLLDATATLNYALYTGTVCGSLTQVGGCVTGNGGVANSLVIGQTYRVRVYSPGTAPTTITFNLCIGTNSGTCPTALPLCAINPIIFPNNVGVPSTPGSTGCLGSAPSPTYYYLQIPLSGNYTFFIEQNTLSNFTGAGLDVDFASWGPYASNAIACTSINQSNTLPAPNGCSFSAAPTETFTINGAIAGQVYVLMITNYTASTLPGRKGFIRITQTGGPVPTFCCPYTNFTYPGSIFCQDAGNIFPTLTSGATAGTYTSTTGLSINSVTGEINFAASTVGTYTVTNTVGGSGTCPLSSSTWSITISPVPSAAISYSSTTFCISDNTTYNVTQTGTTGGSYSVSPLGLSINPLTGSFNPSTSTINNYTVTYSIAASAGCPVYNTTALVAVSAAPTTGFVYDSATYCQNGTNPVLSYIGSGVAGTFTSTAGLSLDGSTGAINLATSAVGGYTITNFIAASGGCPSSTSTFDITITAAPIATFSYVGTPYCQDSGNQFPTFSGGGTAGAFTSTAGLVFVDTNTGEIDLLASTPGTYTVTNTVTGINGCADVFATAPITITVAPQATIAYNDTYFCGNDNTPQAVTLTGTTGGVYNATPTGLTINTSTGEIDPSVSTAGTYTITYTIAASGGCPVFVATTNPISIIPEVAVEIKEECLGPIFTLTALPISGSFDPLTATYEWTGPNGFVSSSSSSPTVEISQTQGSGVYVSTVTFNGCLTVTNHTVASTICTIQKGISPNGDGLNESFLLADVKKLSIFNRYGTKVYDYGSGYTNQWHGQSNKGDELPVGTYFYVVERNTGVNETGWIYINR